MPKLQPREDWGLFGPGSPTWKVWTSPTSLIGFQRSVVIEHFDPFLAAAVADSDGIYSNAARRFDRTLDYFLTVAVADSATVARAAATLMKVHAKATGVEPITGRPYSANAAESQLWIHITGWQSNLLCYERYGPGPLSAAEEKRYWEECVIAAELQTCDPAEVPRSRDEVRAYYERVRPRLCTSERARRAMHYLLRTPRSHAALPFVMGSRAMAPATIATIPRWMRELGDFDQPRAVDAAVVLPTRAAMRAIGATRTTGLALRQIAPRTAASYDHWMSGEPPLRDEVVAPAGTAETLAAA